MRAFSTKVTGENLNDREKWVIKAAALIKVIRNYIRGNEVPADPERVATREREYPGFDAELEGNADIFLGILTVGSKNRFMQARDNELAANRRFDCTVNPQEITEVWLDLVIETVMDEPAPGTEPEGFRPQPLPGVRDFPPAGDRGQGRQELDQNGIARVLQMLAENQALMLARNDRNDRQDLGNNRREGTPRADHERTYTPKSREVGEFEPEQKPDHTAAYNWLVRVKNSIRIYTEEKVMSMIVNCFQGSVAVDWLSSLSPEDLEAVTTSYAQMEAIVKRDWFLPMTKLRIAARDEKFNWSQGRMPTEYMTVKIKLYRMTGMNSEDELVTMVHDGIEDENLQSLMATSSAYSVRGANTITAYEEKLRALQDNAKAQWEANRQPRPRMTSDGKYFYNLSGTPLPKGMGSQRRDKPQADQRKEDNRWTHTNGRRYQPCKHCGGPHFHDLCTKKDGSPKPKVPDKRASVEKYVKSHTFINDKKVKGFFVPFESDDEDEKDEYSFMGQDEHEDQLYLSDSELTNTAYIACANHDVKCVTDCEQPSCESELPLQIREPFTITLPTKEELTPAIPPKPTKMIGDKLPPTPRPKPLYLKTFAHLPVEQKGHGFMGTASESYQCQDCGKRFVSNSRLHRHLAQTQYHGKGPTAARVIEADPQVIRSITEHLLHENTMRTYCPRQAYQRHHLDPTRSPNYKGVYDTGYGNSAIDREHLEALEQKGLAGPRKKLTTPRQVTGIGGGKEEVTEVVEIPVYLPAKNGQLALFRHYFHIFQRLGTPLLVGGDILEAEKINLLHTDEMVIHSCHGLRVKTFSKTPQRTRRPRIICPKENITIPPNTASVVPIRALNPLGGDYRITPTQHIACLGMGTPHGIISGSSTRILVTNFNDTPFRLGTRKALAFADVMDGGFVAIPSDPNSTEQIYEPDYPFDLPEGITVGDALSRNHRS